MTAMEAEIGKCTGSISKRRIPHGSYLTARQELKQKYLTDLHTTKIATQLKLSFTCDIFWGAHSCSDSTGNWYNLLIRKLQGKTSEQRTLVMYIKLDPLFWTAAWPRLTHCKPCEHQQLMESYKMGSVTLRKGSSPQASSPETWGSDCTKSNLKDCPDPLLDSRHYTLFAFPCNREETEKKGNQKPMPEAAQPANELGKAAGLQPPAL